MAIRYAISPLASMANWARKSFLLPKQRRTTPALWSALSAAQRAFSIANRRFFSCRVLDPGVRLVILAMTFWAFLMWVSTSTINCNRENACTFVFHAPHPLPCFIKIQRRHSSRWSAHSVSMLRLITTRNLRTALQTTAYNPLGCDFTESGAPRIGKRGLKAQVFARLPYLRSINIIMAEPATMRTAVRNP